MFYNISKDFTYILANQKLKHIVKKHLKRGGNTNEIAG